MIKLDAKSRAAEFCGEWKENCKYRNLEDKTGDLLAGNYLNSHELMCVSLLWGKASFADQGDMIASLPVKQGGMVLELASQTSWKVPFLRRQALSFFASHIDIIIAIFAHQPEPGKLTISPTESSRACQPYKVTDQSHTLRNPTPSQCSAIQWRQLHIVHCTPNLLIAEDSAEVNYKYANSGRAKCQFPIRIRILL